MKIEFTKFCKRHSLSATDNAQSKVTESIRLAVG